MKDNEYFGMGFGASDNGREWQAMKDDPEENDSSPKRPGTYETLRHTMAVRELAAAGRELRMSFRVSLRELGDRVMSRGEYEEWEDDLADYYEEMQEETRGMDPEYVAKIEAPMTDIAFRERKTVSGDYEKDLVPIEAYAGHFMRERITDLRDAIEGSGESDAEACVGQIEGFYETCLKHSEFLNPESMDMPSEIYEQRRTKAHNEVIKALNALNDLCRRFDVRPLTMRNFEDTDGANGENLHAQEQVDRKKADRGMAELYYSIAFKDLAEKATPPDFEDDFQKIKYFHELGNDGGD